MPRFIAFHPALFLFLFGATDFLAMEVVSRSGYSVAMILFVSITSEVRAAVDGRCELDRATS
jgi:hypothetical protein